MNVALTEAKIKRWGNSMGIVIPKEATENMELKEGERVSVDIVKKIRANGFGICKGAGSFHREGALDR